MVDFKVYQTKNYPFFIEEELCEIQLTRAQNHYQYHFHINQEADTPRNRVRKKKERKHRLQTYAFFGFILLLVVITSAFAIRYDHRLESRRQQALLEESSHQALGRVISSEKEGEMVHIQYEFTADYRQMKGKSSFPADSIQNLFPISPQDEFYVQYVWFQPGVNSLSLNQPSTRQIERYFEKTAERHAELHPELSQTQVLCLVDLAYEIDSLPGLAKFYLQNLPVEENPYYNQDSYHRLIRDLPFARERERRCW